MFATAGLGADGRPLIVGPIAASPSPPKALQKATSNTDIIDMDLEPEIPSASTTTATASAPNAQTDIEHELREFLDGGAGRDGRSGPTVTGTTTAANSTSVLTQMMMH